MGGATGRLEIYAEPDAVPRARRFSRSALEALNRADLLDDVQLVVTELVTNALLHAGPPVVLRLGPTSDGVRVEVLDGSRTPPLPGLASAESMTGRGVALVESLARRWGVEPSPTGKVVWCELAGATTPDAGDGAVMDVEALLGSWDDGAAEERFAVRLGDVPTHLLISAKAHVDNLVREFALAASGASGGSTAQVPPHLAGLIDRVVHRFADARQAIKRQALAAAEHGEPRTELTLALPLGAAEAGEEYLAALDEVDGYARAARLLTLETPPQHRAFRRWYVQGIVAQLRAVGAGRALPALVTFEDWLLGELDTVVAAQRRSERAARLQTVTAALAATTTAEQVAEVVVREGVSALRAVGGGLLQVGADERLDVVGSVGYDPTLVARLHQERRDADLPAAVALRTGAPVWLESRQDRDEQFPDMVGLEPDTLSLCAVPLIVGGHLLGALRFSFDAPQLFDDDERRFVLALAAQTAQALERSALLDGEREARQSAVGARRRAEEIAARLARLQRVDAELARAVDVDEVADVVVTSVADALGVELAAVCLLDADGRRLNPIRVPDVSSADAPMWDSFDAEAHLPASLVARTGLPRVYDDPQALAREFPALSGEAQRHGRLVFLPLATREQVRGVLCLSFPADRPFGEEEMAFAISLATAGGHAVDRVEALAAATALRERAAFLADASAALTTSLDYRTVLETLARLVIPRLADWCSVHVVEDGRIATVAVAHVDPDRIAFVHELLRRSPTDPRVPSGAPHVIRTGVPELVPRITDEMLVAGAVDAEQLRVARELRLSSALTVPLTAAGGVIGALTLCYAESGRHYDADDLAYAQDIGRRAALAVDNARAHRDQTGRLVAVQRVAEAAQRAILAPPPERVGPLRLAAAYLSAAAEAQVGGDLYEVVEYDAGARLLIGDVRGKGLAAVRLATVVLGEFRAAAADHPTLPAVVARMDARIGRYLGEEDFVTAVLVDVRPDGSTTLANCGHPPPLLRRGNIVSEVVGPPALPLGLGAAPAATELRLVAGDRLLLHTDGLVEARDPDGAAIDRDRLLAGLADPDLPSGLARILSDVHAAVRGQVADDLALLVAEYDPAG